MEGVGLLWKGLDYYGKGLDYYDKGWIIMEGAELLWQGLDYYGIGWIIMAKGWIIMAGAGLCTTRGTIYIFQYIGSKLIQPLHHLYHYLGREQYSPLIQGH